MEKVQRLSIILLLALCICSVIGGVTDRIPKVASLNTPVPAEIDNGSSSSSPPLKDVKVGEISSRLRDGPPEYFSRGPSSNSPFYSTRDRYSRPDTDRYIGGGSNFITSYGGSKGFSSLEYDNPYIKNNRDRLTSGWSSSPYGGSSSSSSSSGYSPYGFSSYDSNRRPYEPSSHSYGNSYSSSSRPYGHDITENEIREHDHDWMFGQGGGGGGGPNQHKKLAKTVLLPLAGLALLGMAAALVVNPFFIPFAPAVAVGKRRRRDISNQLNDKNPSKSEEAHRLAFRSYLNSIKAS